MIPNVIMFVFSFSISVSMLQTPSSHVNLRIPPKMPPFQVNSAKMKGLLPTIVLSLHNLFNKAAHFLEWLCCGDLQIGHVTSTWSRRSHMNSSFHHLHHRSFCLLWGDVFVVARSAEIVIRYVRVSVFFSG